MKEEQKALFSVGWWEVATIIHQNAIKKGWWENNNRNVGEILCLIHSEISEACEAFREGNPPDKHLPKFSGAEVELADTVIRIMDFAKAFGLNVPGAVLAKIEYNETRPHRHGGKYF